MSGSRFEVVQTDAGWHSRLVARNGRIVWTTEVYKEQRGAVNAISVVASVFYGHVMHGEQGVTCLSDRNSWDKTDRVSAEIRHVDERTGDPS